MESNASKLNLFPDTSIFTFRRKIPPPTSDIQAIIKDKIRKFKNNSFIYLTYTVPKTSEFWTGYSLVEVPYKHTGKCFYTISRYGVTYFSAEECFFTKLNIWEREYGQYQKLLKVLKINNNSQQLKIIRFCFALETIILNIKDTALSSSYTYTAILIMRFNFFFCC